MGKLNKFRKDVEKVNDKIVKVIELSDRLQHELGITDDQVEEFLVEEGKISCGAFEIMAFYRDFKPIKWVLEIIEKGKNSLDDSDPRDGYLTSWMREEECNGSRTINLPPDEVINEVIDYIKKNN